MIILDMSDKRPLYEQITERFRELIIRGILKADEQMPSVRNLAVELSINPNTIQRAYTELERSGYTYSVRGRGHFVSDLQNLLPERQRSYFEALDGLLSQMESYAITKEQVVQHVRDYGS